MAHSKSVHLCCDPITTEQGHQLFKLSRILEPANSYKSAYADGILLSWAPCRPCASIQLRGGPFLVEPLTTEGNGNETQTRLVVEALIQSTG